jgi:hypothetical protein
MAWKKACESCGTEFPDDDKLRWHIEVGVGGEGRSNPKKRIAQHWFCTGCVVAGVEQAVATQNKEVQS